MPRADCWAGRRRSAAGAVQAAAGADRRAAFAEGDPGSIYLWVEALDDDNRPSGVPRAYRLPYSDQLAEKTDRATSEIAAGRPQGGRAADFGTGEGGLIDAVRAYITPNVLLDTSGGDPSTGGGLMAPAPAARASVYAAPCHHACRRRTNNRNIGFPAARARRGPEHSWP